jgi:hypothetical protein
MSSAVQRARLFRRSGYVEQMPFAQGPNRLSHRLRLFRRPPYVAGIERTASKSELESNK